MGSRSFGKKKEVTYSSISTSDKSILTEQDFHVVQFIIAKIFVFKHSFRNLNVYNVKQQKILLQPVVLWLAYYTSLLYCTRVCDLVKTQVVSSQMKAIEQ